MQLAASVAARTTGSRTPARGEQAAHRAANPLAPADTPVRKAPVSEITAHLPEYNEAEEIAKINAARQRIAQMTQSYNKIVSAA